MEAHHTVPHYAVIVAGGAGLRMQSDIPKQFIKLCGRPVLMHSIAAFADVCKDGLIVVVLPPAQIEHWQALCRHHSFVVPHQIAEGGETRFHSVKNGLSLLPKNGLVAVHDGVRPLVSRQTINRCFHMAGLYGNAVPVIPVIDSVREVSRDSSYVLDRSKLRLIQTPQVFDITLLREVYEQTYVPAFTDDASVFERAGHVIRLTDGNVENIKITTSYDLIVAEAILTTTNN